MTGIRKRFLRHPDLPRRGQFNLFFGRVAHRLQQLIKHREVGDFAFSHVGDTIESESHQCFRFNVRESLAAQNRVLSAPTRIGTEAEGLMNRDPFVEEASKTYYNPRATW